MTTENNSVNSNSDFDLLSQQDDDWLDKEINNSSSSLTVAKETFPGEVLPGQFVEFKPIYKDYGTRVGVGTSTSGLSSLNAQTATINVTYNGFTPEAQTAFQYAVDIWADLIKADVPIDVVANFTPLETLGSA